MKKIRGIVLAAGCFVAAILTVFWVFGKKQERWTAVKIEGENETSQVQEKDKKKGWELTQYSDASGNQSMFYTLVSKDNGTMIVVDGGWSANEQAVREVIRKNGNVVDLWILTHYHGDHVSAFNAIGDDLQGIEIRQILATPLDWDTFSVFAHDYDEPEVFAKFLQLAEDKKFEIDYPKRGDIWQIGNLTLKFFNTCDSFVTEEVQDDIPNNVSLVFTIRGDEDSILFCGDCHTWMIGDWLYEQYGEEMSTEYVQVGHHGTNSFSRQFYDKLNPQIALFDAPQWLMERDGDPDFTSKGLKQYFVNCGKTVYDQTTAPNRFLFR